MPVSGRPEPVALLDSVKALVAALVAAGCITLPEGRVFVLGTGLLITVALTLYTRGKVTPVTDPVGPAGEQLTPDEAGWDGELDVDDTDLPTPAAAPAEPVPAPLPAPPTSPPARLLGPVRPASTPSGWNGYPVPQVPPSAPRPTPPPATRGRGRHAAPDPNDAITPQDWVR